MHIISPLNGLMMQGKRGVVSNSSGTLLSTLNRWKSMKMSMSKFWEFKGAFCTALNAWRLCVSPGYLSFWIWTNSRHSWRKALCRIRISRDDLGIQGCDNSCRRRCKCRARLQLTQRCSQFWNGAKSVFGWCKFQSTGGKCAQPCLRNLNA